MTTPTEQLKQLNSKLDDIYDKLSTFSKTQESQEQKPFNNKKSFDSFTKELSFVYKALRKEYTKLSESPTDSPETAASILAVIDAVSTLLDKLKESPGNNKQHIHTFGCAFKELFPSANYPSMGYELTPRIDILLNNTIQLRLKELDIFKLDVSIDRIKTLEINKNPKQKEAFLEALENLRAESRRTIEPNDGVTLDVLNDTITLLDSLTFKDNNKAGESEQILNFYNTYQKKCDDNPKYTNFSKGVLPVISGALGFVLGIIIMVPFLPFILPVPAFVGTCIKEISTAAWSLGKELSGIPSTDSVSRYLLFQPVSVHKAATIVGQKIMEIAELEVPQPQDESIGLLQPV